jgi:hypothetical protein
MGLMNAAKRMKEQHVGMLGGLQSQTPPSCGLVCTLVACETDHDDVALRQCRRPVHGAVHDCQAHTDLSGSERQHTIRHCTEQDNVEQGCKA